MEFSQEDFNRLVTSDKNRRAAEASYAKNPLDADNLTIWGSALVELSQFHSVAESKGMIEDGISKLKEALAIDPSKADTLWALANAQTSHGFMVPDANEAKLDFDRAAEYYRKAVEMDPSKSEHYQRSLAMLDKAPEMHMEIQHGLAQQAMTAPGGSSKSSKVESLKKKEISDFTYDVCGWIILAVGFFAWVGMAKNNSPPPPVI